MRNIELRDMFLLAGVPEAQVDEAVAHFQASKTAARITSLAEYRIARVTSAAVDGFLDPGDINTPVARYVIRLGLQLAEWENAHPGST